MYQSALCRVVKCYLHVTKAGQNTACVGLSVALAACAYVRCFSCALLGTGLLSGAMAAIDDAAVLDKVESELKYQMDEAGVPLSIQLMAYRKGFDCIRVFAGIDETKAEVRKALKDELPLDYSADAESRRNMALLLAVWDACRLHLAVQEKNKTDAKMGVQARNVPSTEHAAMRLAVEKLYGKLKDKELPSKTFLAQKLEQVEDNAPQAEDLRDVTSLEDAEMEAYNALIDPSTFTLRIKPGRTTTTPPATPEELRMRHRRLGFAWEMVKTKHLSRSCLPDRCVDAFRELSDHVLGSHVAGLRAPGGHAPSWSMVLVYEGELRKAAYRYVRDGTSPDLHEALKRACNASEIMSTFFVVPFTLAGSERSGSMEFTSLALPPPESWWQRGSAKGKGKGKVNQVKKLIGKSYRTPDNKCICFWFNRKTGCQRADCKYEHVCQRCFEKHSYVNCPHVRRTGSDE